MRSRTCNRIMVAVFIGAFVTVAAPGMVGATPIEPGFDLFRTTDGAKVDLSSIGLGIIDLGGVPFRPGATDTIVERIDGINPFAPPNGGGVIEIELVALHLESIAPVDLSPFGGPFVGLVADLHLTVNKGGLIPGLPQHDVLLPSIGQMEVRHEDPDGGTFDSCFGELTDGFACGALGVTGGGVFADAIFTIPGGDPANFADIFFFATADRISLASTDSTWSHTPPAFDQHNAMFPAGEFHVTEINHDGPHPVAPAPEPASAAMLAIAGLLLGRRRR